MKKIITLIMMFVLSAGFLMAQGVFTYQAVVYDAQGDSLVVNKVVNANVVISDGVHPNFEQEITGIQTSKNGLAVLPIGIADNEQFQAIDWSKAKIKVDFTVVGGATIAGETEQIPAVPYALNADAKITTQMVHDYVVNAKMDDVDLIVGAMSNDLKDALLDAIVDSMKNNYDLVKDIVLSYMQDQNLDAQDAKQLFDSLVNNAEFADIMDTVAKIALQNLETDNGKALVLDVVNYYAAHLTNSDVNSILNAVPEAVKDTLATRVVSYLLSVRISGDDGKLLPALKNALEEIAKDYLRYVTIDEMERLVTAVEDNAAAMSVLQPQFDKWMNEYVDSIVRAYAAERYYQACDVDLCQIWNNHTGSCFTAPESVNFTIGTNYDASITFTYTGPGTFTKDSVVRFFVEYDIDGTIYSNDLDMDYLNVVGNTIQVSYPTGELDIFTQGNPARVIVGIRLTCLGHTADDWDPYYINVPQ
jgi:hypothetical protein